MNPTRRTVLKGTGASATLGALIAAGVLKPTAVLAADWNKGAFEAKDTSAALKGIAADGAADSKDLVLTVPEIAENGAVVPVGVVSNIPNTTSIAVLVEKNNNPLSSYFEFANGAMADVQVRLKLGQTSNVRAIAKAGGKSYTVAKEVKVTVGGCGG
jgi:sulfur-oxidizing protein SoxY